MRLTIHQLKTEARQSWELGNYLHDAVAVEETFKSYARKFGDLRRRDTWENVCITLHADLLLNGYAHFRDIITWLLCPNSPIGKAYPDRVLNAVLAHPTALDAIKQGLEQLFYDPVDVGDRATALEFLQRLSGYQSLQSQLPRLVLASPQ